MEVGWSTVSSLSRARRVDAVRMFHYHQHWLIIITCILGIFCLWRSSSRTQNVVTSTSIQVDLSLPSPTIINQRVFNVSRKYPNLLNRRHRGAASRYMLQLYHRRPSADIVRAISPLHVSGLLEHGGGRILEFQLPPANPEEYLEAAELLGTAGMVLRVKFVDHFIQPDGMRAMGRDESWRAFDVTSAVRKQTGNTLKLLVRGRVSRQPGNEGPILLLRYTKPKKRTVRSIEEEGEDPAAASWSTDSRRRKKNPCRKRPLYVDFSAINYDDWIVAPPGYDAYQCMGKCFFPFPDHLNPTKHAIVQSLLHGALQGEEGGKTIGRVCCVPTRLAPTSLLYLDASGTLTYQYGYEDMVVVECGCR